MSIEIEGSTVAPGDVTDELIFTAAVLLAGRGIAPSKVDRVDLILFLPASAGWAAATQAERHEIMWALAGMVGKEREEASRIFTMTYTSYDGGKVYVTLMRRVV